VSRDERILIALKKLRVARFIDIMRETGLSEQTLNRGLTSLKINGEVLQLRERGPYALKRYKHELEKEHERHLKKAGGPYIPFEIRKGHTDALKGQVIIPWLEQLPRLNLSGIYKSEQVAIFPRPEYKGEKLQVESNIIFNDFQNHLCFKPDPFEKLDKLKKYIIEFWEKRVKFLLEINKWVNESFAEQGFKISDYPPRADQGKKDTISKNLAENLLYSALLLRNGQKEFFDREYLNFSSQLEPEKNDELSEHVKYYIWGSMLITVGREGLNREVFQNKIDEKIKNMVHEIKKGKYSEEASEMMKLVHELKCLKEEIEIVLKKHLNKVMFPGDCEYIKA
jgi:hypothetical protein